MRKATRQLLLDAKKEKDVENAYRAEIQAQVPGVKITSPFGSDGYAEFETVRALLEFKYDWDLKKKVDSCRALGQLVFYLKKFTAVGQVLPNVLFVGDKNECFALGTSSVQKFLDMKIDWNTAASDGNAELTRAMVEDADITPFVFNVDDNLDFKVVLEKIRALASGEIHQVRATPTNIGALFAYWQKEVFAGSNLTPVEQVDVFLKCLFGGAYLHPTKKVLVVGTREIPINVGLYKSFFSHFEQGYKPTEVEAFYAQKDRLVEDDARRRQGAFFTPTLWVNEAHRMIEGVLGDNWRQDCIVWDPAAGTGNLTRDYEFGDLILSTAEKPDIEVIKAQGYNPGASVFAYDFLNDDTSLFFEEKNTIPDAVHEKLMSAAKAGKRLVFFMNPPYGTAGTTETKTGESKTGIALTAVNRQMKDAGVGPSSQQLYAQFMFRCARLAKEYGFGKYTVATYSVSTFMCSGSYQKFRDFWYRRFAYKAGMLFQASHFADVSNRWGISFTIWSEGTTDSKKDLSVMIKDVRGFAVTNLDEKAIYNSDGREASRWVRREAKGQDAPQMTSGLKTKENLGCRGSFAPGALGYMVCFGNDLRDANDGTYPVSSTSSRGNGYSYLPSNFLETCALYAARKLVEETWATQKDEYLAPTPTVGASDEYKQWNADTVMFSILHRHNNCTSMRSVPYKGRSWTIHNHFFWMTQAEALAALDTPVTHALYKDCKAHPAKDVFGNAIVSTPDPYLASILPGLDPLLSPEAKAVLKALQALWLKSLPMRETYSQEHPELHLGSWDAGVFQCKHLFRDLYPEDWAALKATHKVLADKLRPGVYDLGWLRR